MPLNFNLQDQYYNLNDTAEVNAYIYDENEVPVPQEWLATVTFIISDPNGNQTTQDGVLVGDGHGYVRYTNTTVIGHYTGIAQFTFADGRVKSSICSFEVVDFFNPPIPTSDQVIGELVWRKIEDVFDSDEGGPWLRDMTLDTFSKDKMPEFIAEALFDINQQNPPTNLNSGYFVNTDGIPTQDAPVLVEGTYLAVILHLIASYIEQPDVVGGQVAYENRRDYIQRWSQIYEIEMQRYMRWVALFKRRFLSWHTHGLIFSRAGRNFGANGGFSTYGMRGYGGY